MKRTSIEKRFRIFLASLLLVLSAIAAASADVSPGDVIDKTNWQKVQGLLPESILKWVKKGELTLNIDELKVNPYEMYPPHTLRSLQENLGKFEIDEDGGVIDKKTGELADFLLGYPFPQIDIRDPKAAEKIMHSTHYGGYQFGNYIVRSRFLWIGRSGFQREVEAIVYQAPLTGYPGAKELPNPEGIEKYGIVVVKKPYDIAGTAILTHRFLSPKKRDNTFGYVPAIRRVRRMSSANRSDSFIGTDFCADDVGGYDGKVPDFEFKLLRKQETLEPYLAPGAFLTVKDEQGEWLSTKDVKRVIYGYEKEGWQGAPWVPTNTVWVKRPMYVLEMRPKDPYYNYGPQYLWIDDATFSPIYKVISDRAGEYWKTVIMSQGYCQSADKTMQFAVSPFVICVDERIDHATVAITLDPRETWTYFAAMDLNDYSLAGFQKFCK